MNERQLGKEWAEIEAMISMIPMVDNSHGVPHFIPDDLKRRVGRMKQTSLHLANHYELLGEMNLETLKPVHVNEQITAPVHVLKNDLYTNVAVRSINYAGDDATIKAQLQLSWAHQNDELTIYTKGITEPSVLPVQLHLVPMLNAAQR